MAFESTGWQDGERVTTMPEMRYRLRTLLIVLALGPPLLAGAWFVAPTVINFLSPLWVPSGTRGLVQDNPDGTQTISTFQRDGTVLREVRPKKNR